MVPMTMKRHFPPGVLLFKEVNGVIVDCAEGVDDRSIARTPQIVLVERSTAITIEQLEDVNGNPCSLTEKSVDYKMEIIEFISID